MNDTIHNAIHSGFTHECACGEFHRSATSAVGCTKCREYMPDEPRTATDLRTGLVQSLSEVTPAIPLDADMQRLFDAAFAAYRLKNSTGP